MDAYLPDDRPTVRPTDQQTDIGGHKEVTLSIRGKVLKGSKN